MNLDDQGEVVIQMAASGSLNPSLRELRFRDQEAEQLRTYFSQPNHGTELLQASSQQDWIAQQALLPEPVSFIALKDYLNPEALFALKLAQAELSD